MLWWLLMRTESVIVIDRMFVDEYTGSDYTKKLVGALPKVKANMSQGIPQMIEIATKKRWKEDFDNKHKKRNEIPIMDKFVRWSETRFF